MTQADAFGYYSQPPVVGSGSGPGGASQLGEPLGLSAATSGPLQAAAEFQLKALGATYEAIDRAYGSAYADRAVLTTQRPYAVAIDLPIGLSVGSIGFLSGTTALGTPVNWWFSLLDNNRVQLVTTGDALTTPWAANTAQQLPVGGVAAQALITTTIAAGSSGVNVNTFVGSQTLAVASSASFSASGGTIGLPTSTGVATVTYTGVSGGNTLTGVTTVTNGAGVVAGTLTTGATLWAKQTFATTYTGLHYVLINVNATQVPSLTGISGSAIVNALPPILAGQSADTATAVTTFPKTVGALTASALAPYCFVGA